MKYRKKPIVIDAIQFTGLNPVDVAKFFGDYDYHDWEPGIEGFTIKSLEGDMLASPGDWIIKDVAGEFYPCKPDIFDQTYVPLTPGGEHHTPPGDTDA